MELGDQLTTLIVEAGIRPAHMRDIPVDGRLLQMWRGMPRYMYSLMRHVRGATTLITGLRRTIARYRRGRDVAHDRKSARRNSSSHDRSPRIMPDEHPPLASSSSYHGDEARPSATSNQQPAASIMITSHDHHEQAGPSTAEATVLLTEQASTTTMPYIDHVVLPPADASISTSDHHDHEQASRPSTIEATPCFTEQATSTCTSVIDVIILPPVPDP